MEETSQSAIELIPASDYPELSIEDWKRIAKAEFDVLVEVRKQSADQHSHSFRWLAASLLAINGAASIAILDSSIVEPFDKVVSGSLFAMGIVSALLIGVISQRANTLLIPELQKRIGYWMAIEESGVRIPESEAALGQSVKGPKRWSLAGQLVGLLSALFFVAGTVQIGVGLLSEEKANVGNHTSTSISDGDSGSGPAKDD